MTNCGPRLSAAGFRISLRPHLRVSLWRPACTVPRDSAASGERDGVVIRVSWSVAKNMPRSGARTGTDDGRVA